MSPCGGLSPAHEAMKVLRAAGGSGGAQVQPTPFNYSPRMIFGTFAPATGLTAVRAHSCPAAIAASIAWRNASSALTASKRACIAATAAWSFGSSSRGRKSRYPAVMDFRDHLRTTNVIGQNRLRNCSYGMRRGALPLMRRSYRSFCESHNRNPSCVFPQIGVERRDRLR